MVSVLRATHLFGSAQDKNNFLVKGERHYGYTEKKKIDKLQSTEQSELTDVNQETSMLIPREDRKKIHQYLFQGMFDLEN